ncbi:MAG: aminopeptidase [Candidatus Micrarchaeota archaeon]|nr:aminopeptidase [Candidatus Micrarchaeota archaeon]
MMVVKRDASRVESKREIAGQHLVPPKTSEKTMQYGAKQAVVTCMGVKSSDKVFIMTDKARKNIGMAIYKEAKKITPNVELVVLEDYGTRPLVELPGKLKADLETFKPTVTFYVATGQPGEIKFRMPLIKELVSTLKVRHGHMISISEEIMRDGMCVDYSKVHEMSDKVYDIVKGAKKIEVSTPAGTRLVAEFSPEMKWVNSKGKFHEQGKWGNLPEGEVFTCPAKVNGVFVVNGILGDYFSEKYGILKSSVRIEIKDSFVTSVKSRNKKLEAELINYLKQGENSNRVGEFAIGTNVGLTKLIGNLLQDEKLPGIHMAFGDSYGDETKATWSAKSHVDCIPLNCTIKVDGKTIMKNGVFTI